MKFKTPAHPYKPIWIDSRQVEYLISPQGQKFNNVIYSGLGQIAGGCWKSNLVKIETYEMKIDFIRRFEYGHSWISTNYYQRLENNYDAVIASQKCQNIDKLYENVSRQYIVKNEGVTTSENVSIKSMLEVIVAIDHSGQIYLLDGRHRLFIAQILGIKIPVQVGVRHKDWQHKRDEVSDLQNPELFNHPDLQDLPEHFT